MIQYINIILFFTYITSGYLHPVHVSIANLEYNKNQNKIDLSLKIFEDDFRLLFFHLNEIDVDLRVESNYAIHEELIIAYFNSNFKLLANEKDKLKLRINNWKTNEDALWFYFEIPVSQEIRSLKVTNTLLLDLYFDQKNLLILKTEEKEAGYQFDYKNIEKEIKLRK